MTDLADHVLGSGEQTPMEVQTFEDVQDNVTKTTSINSRAASNASMRSLTDRPASTSNDKRPKKIDSDRRPSDSIVEEPTPRVLQHSMHEQDITISQLQEDMISPTNTTAVPSKSPLLTARSVSLFDDVALSERKDTAVETDGRGRSTTTSSVRTDRSLSRSSPSTSRPPLPNTSAPASLPKPLPQSAARKMSSPFAWLARKTSKAQDAISPPPQLPRRHTSALAAGLQSHPDFMLSRLDEDRALHERLPAKEMLKERFKVLRMREETGQAVPTTTVESTSSTNGSLLAMLKGSSFESPGLGITAVKSNEEDLNVVVTSPPIGTDIGKATRSNSIASSTFDPNLAPGTVSGLAAGPSAMQDPDAPVDWDLWQSVVYEGPAAVAKTSAAELNRAIASGIPSAIRGVVWQVLAQSKNEELEGVYKELVLRGTEKEFPSPNPSMPPNGPQSGNSLNSNGTFKESIASSASSIHSETSTPATTNGMTSPTASPDPEIAHAKVQAAMLAEKQKKAKEDLTAIKKLEKTIRKDLGSRTNYSKYAAAAGLQDSLFNVCKAYALFDEGVGYAQGMNFIVMPLLFNMPEEEAFCLLVRLMNHYKLREMFIQDMPGLHLHLYQFERLLEDLQPALCYHLHKRGITPGIYATQWFLTLFAYRFPLQLVLRIYDLILSEGLEGATIKFGLALMQKNAETLLGMHDMQALKIFLNERIFDVYIDQAPSVNSILESGFFGKSGGQDTEVYRADLLVYDACAVKLHPETLKEYTSDYESRNRAEKEREAEIEGLKTTNTTLVAKVRLLEQRAEKADTEHVQMATEMIRSKMENEVLRDANEELRAEIEALKKIVSEQPAEVEKRLKDEMDRIMSRNIEVQNENRALEELQADMENQLVETKMNYAQLNADHEGLKQKWADLRKALDG